jgi:hypothetical protein
MTAAINRRLDDAEKSLLCRLAIAVVASQSGTDEQTAADALDTFTERGEALFRANGYDAFLIVAGNPLIHAERDWLAFEAHAPDWEQETPA